MNKKYCNICDANIINITQHNDTNLHKKNMNKQNKKIELFNVSQKTHIIDTREEIRDLLKQINDLLLKL